jgi:succinate dehydrogenase / fumarate reductase, cytochrome b subunit
MIARVTRYLGASIVKKQLMGLTGLLLCGFLVGHLAGNLLIFVGPEAFNTYGHLLITNPLIYVAEAGLGALFLAHIGMALRLIVENHKARPVKYYMKQPTGRGATFASSTMPYTGVLTLVFLVLHILQFKFGPHYTIVHSGVEMRDLYRLVVEFYQSPVAVLWYVVCMISLGIHVKHGFWSAFQSLGFHHTNYTELLQKISIVFALVVAGGFASLPIFCYFQGGVL